ncbi:MAG: hypothetical protein KGI19_07790 [Thaumarchaeota archaeon]|nr:hypothetical protein [Nitrososphaerota archaeon]
MKNKVLFWIDGELTHFGIAKFVLDKYECEGYAIIDVLDNPKVFFRNQNLIDFKKVWYYDDHLPDNDEKPDLNYLISFEKKYNISLWRMVYLDRMFSIPDEYYKLDTEQILCLLERACKFCDSVLDEIKPDFYVTKMTTMHHNHLFYEVCKSRGIKVMMLVPDRFGKRCLVAQESNKIDQIENLTLVSDRTRTISELQQYMKKYNTHEQTKQVVSKFNAYESNKIVIWLSKFLLSPKSNNMSKHFNNYGKTKSKLFFYAMVHVLKKKYREFFMNRNLTNNLSNNEPFVYYPLHYYPERLYLIDAAFHNDQISLISNIAKSLPIGYKLYVKEHPAMALLNWREKSFYTKIINMPNVKLIHPSVSGDEMLKKCSLVITLAGTSGLEAAFYEKPSIVLTDVIYSHLPFVHRLEKIEDLPLAIKLSLQKNVDPLDLNGYVNMIEQNSFEIDLIRLLSEIDKWFYSGGVLYDTEISIEKMASFLEEHHMEFEKLAEEHIKKMKKYAIK